MFGPQIKTPKVKTATNNVSSSGAPVESKTCSQKKGNNIVRKIQAHTNLTEQQKWVIKNSKATQATGVSPQQLVNVISQAMSCLHVGDKKALTSTTSNGGKKF